MNLAELVAVIKTESTRGDGTSANPVRTIVQYWELDGCLIAEIDPYEQMETMPDQ